MSHTPAQFRAANAKVVRDQKRSKEARRMTRELIAQRPSRLYGLCGYCGALAVGPTCRSHRDLLTLDPATPLGLAAVR